MSLSRLSNISCCFTRLFRNINLSTVSESRDALSLVTVPPAVEKTRSDDTDVAGTGKNQALHQAYQLLRNVAESKPATDAPESYGSDLYVICAETAFQNGLTDMAKECLKMYFMKPPPANQFLCRAYLCQAQLLAPQEANNAEQLEKAVVYLVKAISFAKKNPRYHFLVYNASVIYWQFCRPFLKPKFRQYLARSLHQVVKALDDIEDKDFEWRAQLMVALIECHLDAGRKTDASGIAQAAASFIKQNVPHLYKQVFGLIVRNQLLDSSKLHKDVKSSPELSVYYKILKLKVSHDTNEPREFYSEIQSILNQVGVAHTSTVNVESARGTKSKSIRTHSPGTGPAKPEELEKESSAISPVNDSIETNSDDRVVSPEMSKSPAKGTGRRTPTPTTTKQLATDSPEKPYLLLELARFCVELGFPDLAQDCVDHMKTCVVKDPAYYLELEFLQCELMVKGLGDTQESFQRSVIDTRLQAIKRCEETIMNAIRQGDPNVIQAGCVTQWNLCLPLLQPNLRKHCRKPLTLLAEALEDIHSLLISLRCQIHTELAKCEEDQEQIQVAMEHLVKALQLDDADIYRERLEVALHRLELRSQLYKQPERAEDVAAMIIEQARKADSGTMRMKRSLLVKAGEALAPDAFQLVLDSESDTKDPFRYVTGGKAPTTQIQKLANKARQFNKCVKKAEGHLQRLGDENDRERARLWGDLAKTARKQEVWDVCRVAARFCLLYDDGRWKNVAPVKMESPKPERKAAGGPDPSTMAATVDPAAPSTADIGQKSRMMSTAQASSLASRPSSPERMVPLYDKDLIRMLAEVAFIQGEATVHLLRTEGVQLNDMPIPPVDKSKRPKGYVAKLPEEDPDWIEYCEWIKSLSEDATRYFLRGLDLGVELNEAWLVCCAAAYIWNYNNHVLTQLRHREVMDTLAKVIEGLKSVGHAGETVMLVNICSALAYALMLPWIPKEKEKEMQDPASPSPTVPSPGGGAKKGAKPGSGKNKAGQSTTQVLISPDALPDLKRAIEVCEFAIETTNGSKENNMVPISIRLPLLQTWVLAKQMAQQQVAKSMGADDEPYAEGQKQMTRAIVATEMCQLSRNGIMEFKETPQLSDIGNMIEECKWTDKFVELQLWSRLSSLSFLSKNHDMVVRCSKKALRFATVGTQPRNRKMDAHRYTVEQEMLSYASGILGQSLIENMAGKNAIRREAMEAFLNSARYARNAENYDMVMTAVRHYWNACLPLISQPIERELIREPVKVMLQCINATAEKIKKEEEKQEEDDDDEDAKTAVDVVPQKTTSSTIGSPEDDLTLRASLYGVLFQSYADKRQWEEGLQAMDQAIADMPRTKHRLLIFKHRVMTKAKLGRSVNMDIQKFKDENEDYVAHMWRRVALSSKETLEQLISYQAAIEALNSPSNEWLKVDYLLEFGQWLYSNEFPLQDAIDQLEWAVDIMINMKTDTDLKKEAEAGAKRAEKGKKGGKASAKSKPAPPISTPKPSARESPDMSSESRSVASDGTGSEMDQEGIVPVARQAIIGVLPNNPALAISDLEDVKQIDGLFRAHVLLAEIAGRSSPDYKDYLLMAQTYIMRLWQASVPHSGPVIKEIAKNPPQPPVDQGASAKKGAKGKEEKKEPVKEKPKRKGPLDHLPGTMEEWAVYDVPDEVIEAFNHDLMKVNGINTHTIIKPMLTMYYLDLLVKMLRDTGYNHLSLPVLAFQDLMSRTLLKNTPLNILVHARASDVCLELNMKNGYSFHEKLAGTVILNDEDQAISRDEIALWKEKQIQVEKEEARVKESLAKLAEESRGSQLQRKAPSRPGISTTDMKEENVESHIGKTLGSPTFRGIWTDTAELLIRQGQYQSAREFLNEANLAAIAFDDTALQGHILYLLGRLAYEEAQYKQAYNCCVTAQRVHQGDEMFWYETSMLMAEATLQDYENRRAKRMARGILVHTLNEFQRIADERPNRNSVNVYIVSMLEAKLAAVQASIVIENRDDINEPKVMKKILAASERFESATDKLIKLGYRREVLPIMKEHAVILRHMARLSIETEIVHTYYLQAMMILKEAVSITEEIYRDIQTLNPLQELRNLSLPIQRELADINLECGELMLEIFNLHARETRSRQLDDLRKGSVVKMVEDYIRATPHYSHMEKEWVETTRVIAEDALNKFIAAHNLSGHIQKLRARALCGVGKVMRAFATYSSPDPPTQWVVHELELSSVTSQQEEDEGHKAMEDPESPRFIRYSKQIQKMKDADDISQHYLMQATECLVQALNLAMENQCTSIASDTALELVECCGQYDPQAASQFLALFQSCSASQTLEELLDKAQIDPYTSRLAALLHQRKFLLSRDISQNLSSSSMMGIIKSSLQENWEAWKHLQVQTNHLDLLKEYPGNFNFIILQHSADKNQLYGAILDKSKNVQAGGKNPKQAAPIAAPSRAKVFSMQTSAQILDELLEKFDEHRQSVQQMLLKQEYKRSQAMMRQKMLENLDESLQKQGQEPHDEEDAMEEAKLQEDFRGLLSEMEMYLKPLTSQLAGTLIPPSVTPASNSKEAKAQADAPAPQEYVILLADQYLMQMPLEALTFLQIDAITSISRDFSMSMFHHRFYRDEAAVTGKGHQAAEEKKKQKAKSLDNPMSRIPGLRDASKKQAKIIPLSRPDMQSWHLAVDTMNFRYIVDSHLDCAETELNKPIEVFNKLMEVYEAQFTPRWLGVAGDDHTPSVGEWEIYLCENSSFIFYGMEKLINYLPPAKLSALSIPDCSLLYVLDLAQTSKSFTRQSKLDVRKSENMLALEKPVETAMLASLTGIKSLMANQWHCTLAENANRLQVTMKDLLEGGKTTGETVRFLCNPGMRKVAKPEVEEAPPAPPTEGGGQEGEGGETEGEHTEASREEPEAPPVESSQFNMVCYGLPNLMVAQV